MNHIVSILGAPTYHYRRFSTVDRRPSDLEGDSYWWLDVPPEKAIEAKRLDPFNVRLIDQPGKLTFEVNLFTSKLSQSDVA